ncbi:MAG: hypothetical protein ACLFPS_03540 [Clostridia bacterium]
MEKILKALLVIFIVTGNVVVIMAMNAEILEVYIGIGIVALSLFFLASMYLDSKKRSNFNEEDIESEEDFKEDEQVVSYYSQKINEPTQDQDEVDNTRVIQSEELTNEEEIEELDDNDQLELEQDEFEEEIEEQEVDQSIEDSVKYEDEFEQEYVFSGIGSQKRVKEKEVDEINETSLSEEKEKNYLSKRVRYFKRDVSSDGTIIYKPVKEQNSEALVLSVDQEEVKEEQTREIELNYQGKKDIKVKNVTQALDVLGVKTPEIDSEKKIEAEQEYNIEDEIIVDYDNLGTYICNILEAYKKDYSVVKDISLNELFTYQISQEDDFESERVSFIIQNDEDEPIIGVQIYNHLHKLKDKIFIATVFNKANLPLIAFHENSKYKVAEIKELLYELLE